MRTNPVSRTPHPATLIGRYAITRMVATAVRRLRGCRFHPAKKMTVRGMEQARICTTSAQRKQRKTRRGCFEKMWSPKKVWYRSFEIGFLC